MPATPSTTTRAMVEYQPHGVVPRTVRLPPIPAARATFLPVDRRATADDHTRPHRATGTACRPRAPAARRCRQASTLLATSPTATTGRASLPHPRVDLMEKRSIERWWARIIR